MTDTTDSSMNIHEILENLPHRYPFVLIDRVVSMELGKEITALKNVTINEPFFPGHFPYHPVMPGGADCGGHGTGGSCFVFQNKES